MAAGLLPELELVRRLGGGSTADVFLARDTALQRLVAVKVLRGELSSDPVVVRRFEREAQAAARITHPHVTTVYRVGRLAAGVPYIVMEYIDGRSVRDWLESLGPFAAAQGRTVLAAVADALAAAHEHGIVHRDVQPGNVYVEHRTGRAVLGDFGIAALLESGSGASTRLTAAGVRLGSMRYLSPEQVRGETATEQSDVYSLGVLAYELLTGEAPYDVADEADFLQAHLERRPRALRRLRPDIDPEIAHLVEQCLDKNPNRRPRAAEIAALLSGSEAIRTAAADAGRSAFGQFMDELRRRRVYQTFVAYGAFAAAVLGSAQVIFDAFELTRAAYRALVLITLGGLPAVLAFAWVFDIGAGGIQRTGAATGEKRFRMLMWLGLVGSAVAAALIGWLLLRNR